MPYKLRKAPGRDLYWVVNKENKEKYSKDPIPKERAIAQMKALYANTKDIKGSGAIPANNVLHQIATEAYKGNPNRGVGQFRLLSATPTLKFYKSGNTVIVGIRGTVPSDFEDVKADGLISVNQLETSNRYRKDLAELNRVRSSLPTDDFYGVGHSLGGAILDAFLHTGMLKSGVSYNPAVQPKDFQSNVPNHRIYQKGDPLYALGKNFLKNAPEVREAKPMSWKDRLISYVPYAGKVYNYLNAHNLSNFTGGGHPMVDFSNEIGEEIVKRINTVHPDWTLEQKQAKIQEAMSSPQIQQILREKGAEIQQAEADHRANFSGLNYNPMTQGKSFGIIKNPKAFLDVVNHFTGLELPSDGLGANGSGKKFAESPTPLNPLSREEYLKRARASAKRHGLPYKLLGYADDNKHKLQIPDPDGRIIRFGRKGYGDFIIYSALEASGKVAKGMAEMKRNVFHKSHSKIKGNWSQNAFSPNNLALKVLW
jgi:hypothetical protein